MDLLSPNGRLSRDTVGFWDRCTSLFSRKLLFCGKTFSVLRVADSWPLSLDNSGDLVRFSTLSSRTSSFLFNPSLPVGLNLSSSSMVSTAVPSGVELAVMVDLLPLSLRFLLVSRFIVSALESSSDSTSVVCFTVDACATESGLMGSSCIRDSVTGGGPRSGESSIPKETRRPPLDARLQVCSSRIVGIRLCSSSI
jgi:hypothetical protein